MIKKVNQNFLIILWDSKFCLNSTKELEIYLGGNKGNYFEKLSLCVWQKRYSQSHSAGATPVGLQFFAAIFGFLLGIWGAVALSRVHDLEQDDTLVWSLGLVAVLFSFLTPIVFTAAGTDDFRWEFH